MVPYFLTAGMPTDPRHRFKLPRYVSVLFQRCRLQKLHMGQGNSTSCYPMRLGFSP